MATLRGPGPQARQLCQLVNLALRVDDPALLAPLAVPARIYTCFTPPRGPRVSNNAGYEPFPERKHLRQLPNLMLYKHCPTLGIRCCVRAAGRCGAGLL